MPEETPIGHVTARKRIEFLGHPFKVLQGRVRTRSFREAITSTPFWLRIRDAGPVAAARRLAASL